MIATSTSTSRSMGPSSCGGAPALAAQYVGGCSCPHPGVAETSGSKYGS
jgi:hypothetical protein